MSFPRSVAAHEVEKFRRVKEFWWTPNGALRSLHLMNPIRVQFIRETVRNFGKRPVISSSSNPASSGATGGWITPEHRILDVGCGGGILSESLARVGGTVLGIDACEESIIAAKQRLAACAEEARLNPWTSRLDFKDTNLFELVEQKEQFDVVVASEVIEHVDDARSFLEALCEVTKPGGVLVLSTMDKSLRTAITHIAVAEYLTGVVPRGTHDWAKFIPPKEMRRFTSRFGFQEVNLEYIITYPDLYQSAASKQLQLNFALSKSFNTGHYFWAGVKSP